MRSGHYYFGGAAHVHLLVSFRTSRNRKLENDGKYLMITPVNANSWPGFAEMKIALMYWLQLFPPLRPKGIRVDAE